MNFDKLREAPDNLLLDSLRGAFFVSTDSGPADNTPEKPWRYRNPSGHAKLRRERKAQRKARKGNP